MTCYCTSQKAAELALQLGCCAYTYLMKYGTMAEQALGQEPYIHSMVRQNIPGIIGGMSQQSHHRSSVKVSECRPGIYINFKWVPIRRLFRLTYGFCNLKVYLCIVKTANGKRSCCSYLRCRL